MPGTGWVYARHGANYSGGSPTPSPDPAPAPVKVKAAATRKAHAAAVPPPQPLPPELLSKNKKYLAKKAREKAARVRDGQHQVEDDEDGVQALTCHSFQIAKLKH